MIAMPTTTPSREYLLSEYRAAGTLYVPRENQNQHVEVSYCCTPEVAFERTHDRSDNSVTVVAYRHSVRHEWEPWNEVPKMGRRIGTVWSGYVTDEPRPDVEADK